MTLLRQSPIRRSMSPFRFQLKILVSCEEDDEADDFDFHENSDDLSTVDVRLLSFSQTFSSSSSLSLSESSSESTPLCITNIVSSIAFTSSSILSINGA
ncbi:hypothetical protein OGAPHI_007401 [Ogataea philodendri]|uniref:Uncharacterized protein n=1 Tax=Ogataea philodendri TaxID=1378263 RepID=A0A9P8SZA1_9ASCO|nr:uncharacterized protein OGAPHI_007401 [Ogataea philodendri]KAH3660196.1 hypothetical protein OGAPHI_007401 [Ogataea philodendri]